MLIFTESDRLFFAMMFFVYLAALIGCIFWIYIGSEFRFNLLFHRRILNIASLCSKKEYERANVIYLDVINESERLGEGRPAEINQRLHRLGVDILKLGADAQRREEKADDP